MMDAAALFAALPFQLVMVRCRKVFYYAFFDLMESFRGHLFEWQLLPAFGRFLLRKVTQALSCRHLARQDDGRCTVTTIESHRKSE
jgi:hypothetical protein